MSPPKHGTSQDLCWGCAGFRLRLNTLQPAGSGVGNARDSIPPSKIARSVYSIFPAGAGKGLLCLARGSVAAGFGCKTPGFVLWGGQGEEFTVLNPSVGLLIGLYSKKQA